MVGKEKVEFHDNMSPKSPSALEAAEDKGLGGPHTRFAGALVVLRSKLD